MKILVVHGPNLNLFGRREPHIYGTTTLDEINAKLKVLAKDLKVSLAILQSNHEGALIDFFHKHIDSAAGAIINPGGLTQYSVSLDHLPRRERHRARDGLALLHRGPATGDEGRARRYEEVVGRLSKRRL